jgi:hypothetical protein
MPEHEANDAPAGEIAQCFQGHAHAPGRAADGAARQQDRRDEVERHRRWRVDDSDRGAREGRELNSWTCWAVGLQD